MTREIKFRAFIPKGYKRWGGGGMVMFSWEELLDDMYSEPHYSKSVLGIGMAHKEYGVVFMQYTGLKDKNGKEVYEGDIVQLSINGEKPHHIGKVEYLPPKFFVIDGEKSGLILTDKYEVIGNVYENQELLKQ